MPPMRRFNSWYGQMQAASPITVEAKGKFQGVLLEYFRGPAESWNLLP